jgi:hypothetical protein
MLFYLSARLDGLTRRQEILGQKVLEYFQERDDCMSYRSVTVEKGPTKENRTLSTYVLPSGQVRGRREHTETYVFELGTCQRRSNDLWEVRVYQPITRRETNTRPPATHTPHPTPLTIPCVHVLFVSAWGPRHR